MMFQLFLDMFYLKLNPWKIAVDFYKKFSDFAGGGVGGVAVFPLADAYDLIYIHLT